MSHVFRALRYFIEPILRLIEISSRIECCHEARIFWTMCESERRLHLVLSFPVCILRFRLMELGHAPYDEPTLTTGDIKQELY